MAISLQKGQKVDLTKGNVGLTRIMAGLGWDTNKYSGGHDFDLDASIFMTDGNDKTIDDKHFIFYNNLQDPAGSVVHMGDNLVGGATEGDDEVITVDLNLVPPQVQKIAFTVTIHEADTRAQNFGQVSNAYIRICNQDTNEELIRYDLGEDFSVETAIVVAELYRQGAEWKVSAIGSGFSGGLAALCRNYGLSV